MQKFTTFIITIAMLATLAIAPAKAAINQAEGLTVSPPLAELNFEPGKTYHQQIKLNNPTQNIITVYPVARNFTASGETGTPTIESPDSNPTYDLASWITFSQPKIVLTSDQEAEFNYTITVPATAEPGGHYASVLFASQPPTPDKNSTQVALASMVGSLILGTVAGDIVEKAEVREFSTNNLIYFKPKADFVLRIANLGNVHFKPTGEIQVKNFGRSVSNLDINPTKGNILPSSVRRFENLTFTGKWWSVGKFSANLSATYGAKNLPLTSTVTFWIIPYWLIGAIAAIILIIIIWLIRRRRKGRKHRKPSITYLPSTDGPTPPAPKKKRIILQ